MHCGCHTHAIEDPLDNFTLSLSHHPPAKLKCLRRLNDVSADYLIWSIYEVGFIYSFCNSFFEKHKNNQFVTAQFVKKIKNKLNRKLLDQSRKIQNVQVFRLHKVWERKLKLWVLFQLVAGKYFTLQWYQK